MKLSYVKSNIFFCQSSASPSSLPNDAIENTKVSSLSTEQNNNLPEYQSVYPSEPLTNNEKYASNPVNKKNYENFLVRDQNRNQNRRKKVILHVYEYIYSLF